MKLKAENKNNTRSSLHQQNILQTDRGRAKVNSLLQTAALPLALIVESGLSGLVRDGDSDMPPPAVQTPKGGGHCGSQVVGSSRVKPLA